MTLNVLNHNGKLLADHFLGPQFVPSDFSNNQMFFDRNLIFIDHGLQFTTGGQDSYAHTSRQTLTIYWRNLS